MDASCRLSRGINDLWSEHDICALTCYFTGLAKGKVILPHHAYCEPTTIRRLCQHGRQQRSSMNPNPYRLLHPRRPRAFVSVSMSLSRPRPNVPIDPRCQSSLVCRDTRPSGCKRTSVAPVLGLLLACTCTVSCKTAIPARKVVAAVICDVFRNNEGVSCGAGTRSCDGEELGRPKDIIRIMTAVDDWGYLLRWTRRTLSAKCLRSHASLCAVIGLTAAFDD